MNCKTYKEFISMMEAFAGKSVKKQFGKLRKSETPGNRNYNVHLSGQHDGRDVKHSTTVSAYNRDEAFSHATNEMKRKHKGVVDIGVDHIGTDD